MIILHAVASDERSKELEVRLQDLVVAFKKVEHDSEEINRAYIEEDGKSYQTPEALEKWFEQLTKELNWQRSLSGDGCYVDPDSNKIC